MSPHLTDDQLGDALGRSIRDRVDDLPTPTPGFDGVERRARQITNRRRALAGAAVGALALFGGIGLATMVGDEPSNNDTFTPDPEPTPTPTTPDPEPSTPIPAVPGGDGDAAARTLLEDHRRLVRIDASGERTTVFESEPGVRLDEAILLADGSLVIEEHLDTGGAGPVRHIRTSGGSVVLSEFGDLAGAAVLDGVPVAFVGDVPDFRGEVPAPDLTTGDLRFVPLEGPAPSEVLRSDAYGIEWSVDQVDVQAGRFLIASSSEAGPSWDVTDMAGVSLGLPLPTDDPEFSGPGDDRIAFEPRLSDDGTTLWWLEFDGNAQSWDLVRQNLSTGAEPETIAVIERDARLDGSAYLDLEHQADTFMVNITRIDTDADAIVSEPPIVITVTDGSADVDPNAAGDPGFASFVQPALTTPETVPTTEDPGAAEWQPLSDLGLAVPPDAGIQATPVGVQSTLVGVVDGDVIRVEPNGVQETVLTGAGIRSARPGGDGSLLIELGDRPTISTRSEAQLVLQIVGEQFRVLSEDGRLNGVAEVNGRPVVFVGDLPLFAGTRESDTGDLRMVDLETAESTVFGADAFGIEWSVNEVFVGGEIVLLDASGYQPTWVYRDLAGNVVELASPSDGRYGVDWGNTVDGVGPDAHHAVLSEDGSTLYWVQVRPGDDPDPTQVAELHSMDVATGEEGPVVEIDLGPTEVYLQTDLTLEGDDLLLARGFWGGLVDGEEQFQHLPPIHVDLLTSTATTLDLSGGVWYLAG